MSKALRIVLIILAVDVVAVGLYFLVKGSGGKVDPTKGYDWVVMDDSYRPASELEEFLKTTSGEQGLLPLRFRNYGPSAAVLKRFRGAKMAGAGKSVLEMTFSGLEDWAIVDIWITGEEGREIRRTVLYVLTGNAWKAGDSGRLAQ